MTISKEQAVNALLDVKRTQQRSASLYKYAKASPHLALWGCIWLFAYGLSDTFPSDAGRIWLIANSLGAALSIYIVLRFQRGGHAARRLGGVALAIAAFASVIFCMSPAYSGKQVAALVPMIVATVYVVFGIWHGRRLLATGFVIAACTMFGFFFLDSHFNLWMAVVGGAALILTSVWLKRV